MNVDTMLDGLVGREGAYSNHPADKGGPTMWGVTEQVARAYGYKGDMRALPRATALAIYRERYWTSPKFDQVARVYGKVAEEMLDTGVNMGVAVPVKFLQRLLNVLNRGASLYPDIAADGIIGRMTIAALETFKQRRGEQGQTVLLRALNGLQVARYVEITEGREANEEFFFGWVLNRVGDLG